MKKVKVLYIISDIDKSLSFEWTVLKLNHTLLELGFVLLNPANSELEEFLNMQGIPVKRLRYRGKKDLLTVFFRLVTLLIKKKPDIVHTHLITANLVGLTAAYICRVQHRFYTRHHSTLHHEYFPRGVIMDKWINRMATRIIALSDNVKAVLRDLEHVNERSITTISHGFDLDSFSQVSKDRIESIKKNYHIPTNSYPVVGAISRYTELKGLQYIIPAFKRLLEAYPQAHLILANAKGDFKDKIGAYLSDLPEGSYTEIVFENDLQALYKVLDIFVHTPINDKVEAFGQTYIEALAAEVPSIFTMSGVAKEFIVNESNALVADFRSTENIYQCMCRYLNDHALRNAIVSQGLLDVKEAFDINKMTRSLEELYLTETGLALSNN